MVLELGTSHKGRGRGSRILELMRGETMPTVPGSEISRVITGMEEWVFIECLGMRSRETRPTVLLGRGVNAYWIDSASLR